MLAKEVHNLKKSESMEFVHLDPKFEKMKVWVLSKLDFFLFNDDFFSVDLCTASGKRNYYIYVCA